MSYDAVVFDNDGVLTWLTELDVLASAVREAFAEVGVADPADDHVSELCVGVRPAFVREVCARYDVAVEEFWRARDTAASRLQQAEIRDGNKPLYDDFAVVRELDAALGIVSSNQHETIEYILEHYELRDLFETHYGREPTIESLERKKPEPHYIERAVADLGVDADRTLYVGDSATDVAAAHAAGVDSAFVRRSHRTDLELDEQPTHEIEGLDELPALVAEPRAVTASVGCVPFRATRRRACS